MTATCEYCGSDEEVTYDQIYFRNTCERCILEIYDPTFEQEDEE